MRNTSTWLAVALAAVAVLGTAQTEAAVTIPDLAGQTIDDVVVAPKLTLKRVGKVSGDARQTVSFGPQDDLVAGDFRIFDPDDGLSVTGTYSVDSRGRVAFAPEVDELVTFLTIREFTSSLAGASDVTADVSKHRLSARVATDTRTGATVLTSYQIAVKFTASGIVGGSPNWV